MGVGLIQGLWLLLLGALGASSLVAKREEGRKALAAIEPYQGWIGVASVAWGAWHLIVLVLYPRFHPWLFDLVVAGLFLTLGVLLGVGIIQSFLKDPGGRDNFEKFVQKLTPYRQTLGVVAMVLGGIGILTALF